MVLNAANIPPEIWLRISRYITDEELYKMIGVNSLFLDTGMDARWRQVLVVTRNTVAAMRVLNRLLDPFVARRVKCLVLRLTHVKEAPSNSKLKQQIQHTFSRVFRFGDATTGAGGSGGTPTVRRPRPTFSDVMAALISTAARMPNVRELNLDSWDLPPSYDLLPLFRSIWDDSSSSFGRALDKLFLGGNLEGYRVLITETQPAFVHLRELRIELTNNLFRLDQKEDARILVDVLAPFIQGCAPRLESLRIWSWAFLDVSPFFAALAGTDFPMLETLNIRMAFNKGLHEPAGLKRFLWRCSMLGLRRLEIRLNPSGLPLDPTTEAPLGAWLLECVAEEERCFESLKALDLYPTSTQEGFSALMMCIRRTEATLEELCVRDRYFQLAEVRVLVDAVAKSEVGLKYLRMNVWQLDVMLLDLLAEKLPGLERLWLSIGDAFGGVVETEDTFHRELKLRRYNKWKVKDITIWQSGQEMDSDTMRALAMSIPSVTSFFGNGDMVVDYGEDPASP